MKESFEGIPFDHPGGGKSLIEFNPYYWSDGVEPKRPVRVEISTDLRDPNGAGLAHGRELGDLATFQERLEILMKRKGSARYVMRVTGEGRQTNIYYIPAALGLLRKRDPRDALEPAIVSFGESCDRPLTVTFHDDPEWSRLLGIFETHDPAQWAWDRQMLVHLAKKRDAVHARRQVAHNVYFPSRDACRDFLRDIRKQLRFKSEGGPKKAAPGKPGPFVIVVVRVEPTIATWHLHPVVLSVKRVAGQHGGVYDGWETELIKSLEPPPLSMQSGPKLG